MRRPLGVFIEAKMQTEEECPEGKWGGEKWSDWD